MELTGVKMSTDNLHKLEMNKDLLEKTDYCIKSDFDKLKNRYNVTICKKKENEVSFSIFPCCGISSICFDDVLSWCNRKVVKILKDYSK